MEPLKLIALDPEDLAIVSAHLQDAVLRAGDLTFLPRQRRFALVAHRFEWEAGHAGPRRRLTGLHFERVLGCRLRGIDRGDPDRLLHLLAITFEPGVLPSGKATLVFAEGGAIQLDLECVETQMRDLGPVWDDRHARVYEGQA
jgi:hypothetical protein